MRARHEAQRRWKCEDVSDPWKRRRQAEGRTKTFAKNKIHLNLVHLNPLPPILLSPLLNAARPPPCFGIGSRDLFSA